MNSNEVLANVVYAGRVLLESGAEIYRVEETIQRMGMNCGMDEVEAFVLPTGIMVTVLKDGLSTSKISRVRNRSINLDKIDKINALSREITEVKYDSKMVYQKIKEIDDNQAYPTIIRLVASALGASAFALLFKGTNEDILVSFLIGVLIFLIKFYADNYSINFFITTVLASFGGVFFTLAITEVIGNADTIVISSLMLLVPGLVITNAIRDSVAQDLGAALSRLLETFLIAIAIALGAVIAIAAAKTLGLSL